MLSTEEESRVPRYFLEMKHGTEGCHKLELEATIIHMDNVNVDKIWKLYDEIGCQFLGRKMQKFSTWKFTQQPAWTEGKTLVILFHFWSLIQLPWNRSVIPPWIYPVNTHLQLNMLTNVLKTISNLSGLIVLGYKVQACKHSAVLYSFNLFQTEKNWNMGTLHSLLVQKLPKSLNRNAKSFLALSRSLLSWMLFLVGICDNRH